MPETVRPDNIVGPVDAGWTVVTLKEYVDTLIEVSARDRALIRTHYDTVLTEQDRRYEARFVASEQAVTTSFSAQEKAINAALAAQQAAVNKAELASDKRFESVNEFRSQLGDQARTFMPRTEAEALIKALGEKLETGLKSVSDKLDAVVARIDRNEARGVGNQQVWGYVAAAIGVMVGIAGLVLALFR